MPSRSPARSNPESNAQALCQSICALSQSRPRNEAYSGILDDHCAKAVSHASSSGNRVLRSQQSCSFTRAGGGSDLSFPLDDAVRGDGPGTTTFEQLGHDRRMVASEARQGNGKEVSACQRSGKSLSLALLWRRKRKLNEVFRPFRWETQPTVSEQLAGDESLDEFGAEGGDDRLDNRRAATLDP